MPHPVHSRGIPALHVRHITVKGGHNNNQMERMNGELRAREKVKPAVKKADSPIQRGIRLTTTTSGRTVGLDGKTLAEAAGITIERENKWQTVIENAKKEVEQTSLLDFPKHLFSSCGFSANPSDALMNYGLVLLSLRIWA
jgi:hypothetical protein